MCVAKAKAKARPLTVTQRVEDGPAAQLEDVTFADVFFKEQIVHHKKRGK